MRQRWRRSVASSGFRRLVADTGRNWRPENQLRRGPPLPGIVDENEVKEVNHSKLFIINNLSNKMIIVTSAKVVVHETFPLQSLSRLRKYHRATNRLQSDRSVCLGCPPEAAAVQGSTRGIHSQHQSRSPGAFRPQLRVDLRLKSSAGPLRGEAYIHSQPSSTDCPLDSTIQIASARRRDRCRFSHVLSAIAGLLRAERNQFSGLGRQHLH